MIRHKLKKEPQSIDEHNWFYDGQKYFIFVHEVYNKEGEYIQTDQFNVDIDQLADFICNL